MVFVQAARPGFFRQNSARSFKLLDLRRSNQSPHSTSSGGLPSPAQLSPPSTPAGLEHAPWPPVCSYSRSGSRIPTVCFSEIKDILRSVKKLTQSFIWSGRVKNKQHFWSPGREETSTSDLSLRWDKLRPRWCWNAHSWRWFTPLSVAFNSISFLLAVTDENSDSESEIEERSKGSTD